MKQAIWLALLAVVAIITAAMQLDRQSRYASEWADYVPQPARYFAQAHVAVEALESDDAIKAQHETHKLLSRRPIPAENVRLVAQADIKAANADQGLLGLQIAAQRGWRDPVTQEAMARIAWAGGDAAASANRLAALYALQSESTVLKELAGEVLSTPEGREQMATLLAGPARWESRFVRRARHDMRDATFNAVMLAAHGKGARFRCGPLRDAAGRQARDMGVAENETELAPLIERNC